MQWLINLILSLFQKDKPKSDNVPPVVNPEPPTKEEVDNFPKKKIAIIIGHGNGDGGANTWNGSNEFAYNSVVAEYIKKHCKHNIETFYRGSSGIVGVALKTVSWNPDISIELHLNSYNGKARGCEVLVLEGDNQSAELGRKFAHAFCREYERVMRGDKGVKWISSGDRGAASLKVLKPIKQSILVEPFFADNPNEWIEPLDYAKHMVNFLNEL